MSPRVCQLWIRDGRDEYHDESIRSILAMLPPPDDLVVVDDHDHRLGFSGAVAEGWRRVLESGCDYVFHAELDFTYNEPVPLDRMIQVLERHPEVVQLSLKRQPVNHEEIAAGDFVRLAPNDYHEQCDGDDVWTQHRKFWTTNPSLYRVELCRLGWPQERFSEGKFSGRYFQANPTHWSGIWGAKYDPPRVHHIGEKRAGRGY